MIDRGRWSAVREPGGVDPRPSTQRRWRVKRRSLGPPPGTRAETEARCGVDAGANRGPRRRIKSSVAPTRSLPRATDGVTHLTTTATATQMIIVLGSRSSTTSSRGGSDDEQSRRPGQSKSKKELLCEHHLRQERQKSQIWSAYLGASFVPAVDGFQRCCVRRAPGRFSRQERPVINDDLTCHVAASTLFLR